MAQQLRIPATCRPTTSQELSPLHWGRLVNKYNREVQLNEICATWNWHTKAHVNTPWRALRVRIQVATPTGEECYTFLREKA